MTTKTGMAAQAFCVVTLATAVVSSQAEAKTPGSTYCFWSKCHRVLTLAETRATIGKPRTMHASHYDAPGRDRYNPSLITSSGEVFRPDAPNNAASPIYPDGTLVAVYAPSSKRGAIVRINNAGPYWGNRLIDLSRGLADKLGVAKSGVSKVLVEVLAAPSKAEATYVRGRRYAPVPGFVGKVASIEAVRETWGIRQGLPAKTTVIAAPARTPSVADSAMSLAASMPADDMRDVNGAVPAIAIASGVSPGKSNQPAPARSLSQATPRTAPAKKLTPQLR